MDALQRWADDDLRRLNGQIEFLLRKAVKEGKRDDGGGRSGPRRGGTRERQDSS